MAATQMRYDFFGGEFQGQIRAPQAQFSASVDGLRAFGNHRFAGARVRIWSGMVGDALPDFALRFDGRVTGEPEVRGGLASFDAGADDSWLDEPLLGTFAGTGGIEGPDDLTGQVKPLILGNVRFGHGTLIDAVNLVYMVSNGPIAGVNTVYDRAASLGSSVGDFADLAALIAADIPEGSWGTCNALGLVRLGWPLDGRVAFDVAGNNSGGYVSKPGAIIGRIAAMVGGRSNAKNLAALDLTRPYDLEIDLFSQTTARRLIQQIADSVGAVAGISWTGELFAQPLAIDERARERLAADGTSDIPVSDVSVLPVSAPFWRLATTAEPTWVVYEPDEVATGMTPRGAYSDTRVYRLDDFVTLSDGSSWVYIADEPSSGNRPALGSAFWGQLSPPTTYADGTPIEDLKPAEPNSTHGAPPGTPVGDRSAEQVVSLLDQAKARTDALENETIPAIDSAILSARTEAQEALTAARLDLEGEDTVLHERINSLVVEGGGYNDEALWAEVGRVDTAAITRDAAIGQQIETVEADFNNALNAKAQEITTAYTDADTALAERTSILASSIGAGSGLFRNPRFADYAVSPGPPSYWGEEQAFGAGSVAYRSTHPLGGYALVMQSGAGAQCSTAQNSAVGTVLPDSYWIVEIDVFMGAGSFRGAGALLRFIGEDGALLRDELLNFYDEFGAGANRTYRLRRMVQAPSGAVNNARLYLMGHWATFGSIVDPNVIRFEYAQVRPATNEEIAAGVALPELSATVSEHETALTDGRFATALRVNTLESQYNVTKATVTEQAGTIAGLEDRTAAYWRTTAVAGNNRAQVTIHADANDGAGVDIVGDLRVIGIITADAFIANQGVDLAAIVPGSLNWRANYASSTDYGPAQSIDSGIKNVGVSGSVTSSSVVTITEIIQSGWADGAREVDFNNDGIIDGHEVWNSNIRIYYRLNSGPWIDTGISQAYTRTAITGNFVWNSAPQTGGSQFSPSGSGTMEIGVRVTGSHQAAGYEGAIYDLTVNFEVVNWK